MDVTHKRPAVRTYTGLPSAVTTWMPRPLHGAPGGPAQPRRHSQSIRRNRGGTDVEFRAMTYCVGLLVDTGLVMLSDSRTNAGVDQINTFRKMWTVQQAPDR